MTRTFIIALNFEKQWSAMGLNDDNLQELEKSIMDNPQVGDVLTGTGGLRKMRFSIEKGKSSGARVMYVDFAVCDQVYLIGAFPKNDKENLTKGEKTI